DALQAAALLSCPEPCVSLRSSASPHPQRCPRMFATIGDVIQRFASVQYITGRTIPPVVYLAAEMKKPILVEGPAGVGKTELAKVLAGALGQDLIRLQ